MKTDITDDAKHPNIHSLWLDQFKSETVKHERGCSPVTEHYTNSFEVQLLSVRLSYLFSVVLSIFGLLFIG